MSMRTARHLFTAAVATVASTHGAMASPPPASTQPIPVNTQVEAKLLTAAGEGFRITRTDHFLIAYDTPEDVLTDFTHRAEATYTSVFHFCERLGIRARRPDKRIEVLFFNRHGDLTRFAESIQFRAGGSAGFYHHATNRAAFANAMTSPHLAKLNALIDRLEGQSQRQQAIQRQLDTLRVQRDRFVERIHLLVFQHEIAHAVLFNAGVHTRGARDPAWLVEGLACVFEPPPSASKLGQLPINVLRLTDARECLATDPGSPKPSEANRLLPLRQLVSTNRAFAPPNDPNAPYHYAQAWLLVAHLQHAHPRKLAEYIHRVARRDPRQIVSPDEELATFEAVFGPLDEQFDRRWLTFALALPVQTTQPAG